MNNWTDINTELPPIDIEVLCYCKEDIFYLGYFCKYRNAMVISESGVICNETSHWKYLETPSGEIIKK